MDIRETAKSTVSALASDPKGTVRFLASAGAKTALRVPAKLGARAAGPALNVAMRTVGLVGSAMTRGRQVRDRLPGSRNGQHPETPVAMPPVPAAARPTPATAPATASVPAPAPEVQTSNAGPPEAAIAVGAPGVADAAVARAEQSIGSGLPNGADLDHDDLPLPDYDHLTLASLRARLVQLDLPSLIQVRDYERAHANRLPVVTMLDNRIAKVSSEPSPTPTAPPTAS